jgi:hypothetical protein
VFFGHPQNIDATGCQVKLNTMAGQETAYITTRTKDKKGYKLWATEKVPANANIHSQTYGITFCNAAARTGDDCLNTCSSGFTNAALVDLHKTQVECYNNGTCNGTVCTCG